MRLRRRQGVKKLAAHEIRELCVLASVDPRTVAKALAGEKVRPLPLERIRRALAEAGREDLLPLATQETSR